MNGILKKILSFLLFLNHNVYSQKCEIDTIKIRYKLSDWLSYVKYVKANNLNHNLQNTYYTISNCYAMLGIKDSSIFYFPKVSDGIGNLSDIYYDGYNGDQWKSAVNLITADFYKKNKNFKKPQLAIELMQLSNRQQSFHWYSLYLKESPIACEKITKAHQDNEVSINKFLLKLSESVYPSTDEIGNDGMNALFMLVQHLEERSKLQQLFHKKIESVLNSIDFKDSLLCSHYAYITDRILVNKGQQQEYGTQFNSTTKELYPIRDYSNVDKRRKKLYLDPLGVENRRR